MTHPTLLPIGAFSIATQLSAKALRLYAEQGILPPTKIDGETGYRYYRPEQVREARLVRLLRQLDMPLADIAELLSYSTALEAPLKRHMDLLARRYAQQQAAYRSALALLRPEADQPATTVTERTMPTMHVVTQSFEADSATLLARARALLAQLNAATDEDLLDSSAAFIRLPAPLSAYDEISRLNCAYRQSGQPLCRSTT